MLRGSHFQGCGPFVSYPDYGGYVERPSRAVFYAPRKPFSRAWSIFARSVFYAPRNLFFRARSLSAGRPFFMLHDLRWTHVHFRVLPHPCQFKRGERVPHRGPLPFQTLQLYVRGRKPLPWHLQLHFREFKLKSILEC